MSAQHAARINSWLTVADCYECKNSAFYTSIMHIYRNDTGEKQERHCKHHPHTFNIRMEWKDGDELNAQNLHKAYLMIDALRSTGKGQTLIHCHAGMCRSPTLAIMLLSMLDGMHPIDAQQLVTKQIYAHRAGLVCNIGYKPFKQIVRLFEKEHDCSSGIIQRGE